MMRNHSIARKLISKAPAFIRSGFGRTVIIEIPERRRHAFQTARQRDGSTESCAVRLLISWSVTSSQAVYFQHRPTPQKLRRGKPVVGCGRSHRLFNPAPPEAWLTPALWLLYRERDDVTHVSKLRDGELRQRIGRQIGIQFELNLPDTHASRPWAGLQHVRRLATRERGYELHWFRAGAVIAPAGFIARQVFGQAETGCVEGNGFSGDDWVSGGRAARIGAAQSRASGR